MGRFINRRDPTYHRAALEFKTQSDLIASILLALNYSGRTKQTPVSQSLIQMDCVAVCFVKDELWVASNTQRISANDIDNLRDELIDPDIAIYTVVNGDSGVMHAEMQLLQELIESGLPTAELEFGVSKPCCSNCRKLLDDYSIRYSMYHNAPVVNWESPV